MASFVEVFRLKFGMQFWACLYEMHAPPTELFLTVLDEECLKVSWKFILFAQT